MKKKFPPLSHGGMWYNADNQKRKGVRTMKPYAYGVDIGGTTIKAGLFSREGRLLDRWTLPTRTEGGGRFCPIWPGG